MRSSSDASFRISSTSNVFGRATRPSTCTCHGRGLSVWPSRAGSSLLIPGQQPLDRGLGLRVLALADVAIPDDAAPVDDDECRPRPHAPAVPDGHVVVLDDGIAHPEPSGGGDDLVVRLLPEELRA